jgi:hypothetical protein
MRAAIASSLLVALALSIVLWGQPLWGKVQLLYWQARCMKYRMPEGTIASSSNRPTAVAAEWTNFYRHAGGSAVPSEGTVFLHERTSANGKRRLVAINVYDFGCFGQRGMVTRVFVPASLFARGREVASSAGGRLVDFDDVLYSGTPDPYDASHFVINYVAGEKTRVIDGWLTNDDRVLLEERQPPVACLTP